MRTIVGLFGAVCGVIVIALVARYGYKTADSEIDGLISGFLFATIAAGGLGGHAVAVRIWRRNWAWALVVGVIAGLALTVNLSNSLGAIAGRGDERTAERSRSVQSVKDDRAELARIIRERETMPAFQAMTLEAVQFARDAVAAAERTVKAECDKRGARCRERESEEQARRTELATVVAQRSATERAARLDAAIAAVRDRLAKARPVENVNPQATALVQLFRLPDVEAASALYYQNLALAIVVELLIAGSFIAFELMREPAGLVATPATEAADISRHVDKRRTMAEIGKGVDGRVVEWIVDRCEPSDDPTGLAVAALYGDYALWCKGKGLQVLTLERFEVELDQVREHPAAGETTKNGDRYFGIGLGDRKVTRLAVRKRL